MIEDASRTAQRSQYLEQVSLHLLAAVGEPLQRTSTSRGHGTPTQSIT